MAQKTERERDIYPEKWTSFKLNHNLHKIQLVNLIN